jgi:cytochrome c oxidase subunit 1
MDEQPNIHLPSPSYWPIVLAFGFALIAIGVVSSIFVSIAGILVVLTSITGWTLENRD